jgi:hypothetical protein
MPTEDPFQVHPGHILTDKSAQRGLFTSTGGTLSTRGPTTFYRVRTAGVVLVGKWPLRATLVGTGPELHSYSLVSLACYHIVPLFNLNLHLSSSVPSSYVAIRVVEGRNSKLSVSCRTSSTWL